MTGFHLEKLSQRWEAMLFLLKKNAELVVA